jgi:hypothetical protein
MVDVAEMDDFPKLRGIEDSETKIAAARAAVAELRAYTRPYEQELLERERAAERTPGPRPGVLALAGQGPDALVAMLRSSRWAGSRPGRTRCRS